MSGGDIVTGYKPRVLKTREGRLDLMVPKDREGRFQTELFEKYQRSEKALMLAIAEMYVQGVSTRKVKKITEELCGLEISKSQVSALAKGLDTEIETWRERPLTKAVSVPRGRCAVREGAACRSHRLPWRVDRDRHRCGRLPGSAGRLVRGYRERGKLVARVRGVEGTRTGRCRVRGLG